MTAVLTVLRRHLQDALKRQDLAEAARLLERLKAEAPLALETRGLELEYFIKAGQLQQADELAAQLCHLFPGSSRVRFLAGKTAYRLKQYAAAEEQFRESLRLFQSRLASYWLGKTLTQIGHLDEALGLLQEAHQAYPSALCDLAWLYERRGNHERALECLETYLANHGETPFIQQQVARLKAKLLPAEEMLEEMSTLTDLGETIPHHLVADYLTRLFESGEAPRARALIASQMADWPPRVTAQAAWAAYHAMAFDQAFELFLKGLEGHAGHYKVLNALEHAALKCHRGAELIQAYERLAPEQRGFYGRVKKLNKKLSQ